MPRKTTLPKAVKKALRPEREASRMQERIEAAMAPDQMSLEEAYRFASALQASLETSVEGLKHDLKQQGVDPYDLDWE